VHHRLWDSINCHRNFFIATLPTDRMPAVLANDDWAAWLEGGAADVKSTLRAVDGEGWTMAKEKEERQGSLF
jgi:putative SOS response-associated peptidase YedK